MTLTLPDAPELRYTPTVAGAYPFDLTVVDASGHPSCNVALVEVDVTP